MKKNNSHKTTIKVVSAALAAAIVLSCTACGSADPKSNEKNTQSNVSTSTKAFTTNGVSITLPDSFKESTQEPYSFYYTSNNAICLGLKESKEEINAAQITIETLDDYAKTVMDNSGITSDITYYSENAKYFIWDKTVSKTEYSYIGFVTQTDNAYWLIQFASLKDEFENSKDDFFNYFDTIKLTDDAADATSSADIAAGTVE